VHSSLPARLIGLAATVLLALGGLTTVPAQAADPMTGAPAVGSCYDLTLKQAYVESSGKPAVSCGAKHTVVVGAVGAIPAGVGWKDEKRLFEAAEKTCKPFWNRQLGRSHVARYQTLLTAFWLMPTPAQRSEGARWISCLVGLQAGDRLVALPKGDLPRVTKSPADSIARCLTKKLQFTPCSAAHAWRATHVFGVTARGSVKARGATLERAAKRVCARKVASRRFTFSARPRTTTSSSYAVACYSETSR
jgi:hypothetical protein